MNRLQQGIGQGRPLLLPGVHDALSARVAEQLGFEGLCVGGAAVGITQCALPDIGLQSFGEYHASVSRIRSATELPILLDAEDGFGDAKAVTRTVRSFERLGISGMILEDLVPLRTGEPVSTVPLDEIGAKLEAALRARASADTWIVGRTDVAHAGRPDEVVARARRFQEIGVDAVLATGLTSLDEMQRLRDSVRLPLIALVVETKPWIAPTLAQVEALGYEIVMHAAALMLSVVGATRASLEALKHGGVAAPNGLQTTLAALGPLLRTEDWRQVDLAARQGMG
ncbi:MAG TPA: isocitrate lyase/PEP mutase family protein [Pseudorhodoferax sp.]|jgi:2-methylisocitrate lyase-like PEP mutase family enzyme|nr:isocitrate lyase/PEP mutase family protein [Pseudorhodoferax sp.]